MFSFFKTDSPIALVYDDVIGRIARGIYFRELGSHKRRRDYEVCDMFDSDCSMDDDSPIDGREFGYVPALPEHPYGNFTEYTTSPGTRLVPTFGKERITMFIAGTQGCGKSYYIGKTFLPSYVMRHPERPIFLVTGLTEKDKNLEGFNISRIKMDEKVLKGLTLDRLRGSNGCLIIFDDTDRIREKKLHDACYRLLGDCLANGRDHKTQAGKADIDVIVTNHEINDAWRTKNILTECCYVLLFPSASTAGQLELVCRKIGMSKPIREKIMDYKLDRSILIHKTYPMYAISSIELFMLR